MPRIFDGVIWIRRAVEFRGATRYGRAFAPPKWHIAPEQPADRPNGHPVHESLCGYEVMANTLWTGTTARMRKTPPVNAERCKVCVRKLAQRVPDESQEDGA